jgi:hypothetical protein
MWHGHPQRLSDEQVYRRASGRRHWNSWKQFLARVRRIEVVQLLAQGMRLPAIAARLNVSHRTIQRDVQVLLQPARFRAQCPSCGRAYAPSLPPGVLP